MSISECDRLDDYLLGGLSEDEIAKFEAHLAGCAACRDQLWQQRRIDSLLAEGVGRLEPVSSALIDRIEERVHRSRRRRVVRWAWGLSAAVLVLVGALVWLAAGSLGTGNKPHPIVQEHPRQATGNRQADPPLRQPRASLVARVTLADPSDAILVPLETEASNVSIVMIYPTVKPVQPPNVPGND